LPRSQPAQIDLRVGVACLPEARWVDDCIGADPASEIAVEIVSVRAADLLPGEDVIGLNVVLAPPNVDIVRAPANDEYFRAGEILRCWFLGRGALHDNPGPGCFMTRDKVRPRQQAGHRDVDTHSSL